jgi:DNA polymerase III epsilon subunit-like protein
MGPTPPPVIDVEASGFGSGSFPIEVGWVLGDGRARCTLVRPQPEWTHWDTRAERVHGIARRVLHTHGRSAAAVARMLNDDLDGAVVYCDGWAHDYPWLALLFDAAGLQPRFQLQAVTRLLDDAGLARLHVAHGVTRAAQGRDRHRASSDARALQQALQQALQPPPDKAPVLDEVSR